MGAFEGATEGVMNAVNEATGWAKTPEKERQRHSLHNRKDIANAFPYGEYL